MIEALAGAATLPSAGVVDVWRVALDMPRARLDELTASLDEHEQRLWARMRVGGDRWAAARGIRRAVLASYSGLTPAALRFDAGTLGKPRVLGDPTLRFNVSTREGWTVIAVSADREVGVDLEWEGAVRDEVYLAAQFLSPSDQTAITFAQPAVRRRVFAQAWTRHEALRKAHGLSLESALPVSEAIACSIPGPEGFAVSVAAQGGDWRIRVREFCEASPLA